MPRSCLAGVGGAGLAALSAIDLALWDLAGILPDPLHVARSHTTLDDLRAIPRGLLHYAQICDGEPGLDFTTEQLVHTARCERLLPGEAAPAKPAPKVPVSKNGVNPNFGMNMPMMSSAFDTAAWLKTAA